MKEEISKNPENPDFSKVANLEWVKVFKKTFRFTGGEIVNEFLMSTGYLPGAHVESCAIYKKALKSKPAWKNK